MKYHVVSEGLACTECSLVECWAFVGALKNETYHNVMEGCPDMMGDIPLSLSFIP